MPIEGLENTDTSQTAETQATPDAAANNTDANDAGAGTDTAQQSQEEKKFTQADLDKYLNQRVSRGVTAKLKELTGEGKETPTVTELQRQLSERDAELRGFKAEKAVSAYLSDARNNLNINRDNAPGIAALVIPSLEYGDDGKPSNLKEAVEAARTIAPALFVNSTANINQGNGKTHAPASDMNAFIRQMHAGRN